MIRSISKVLSGLLLAAILMALTAAPALAFDGRTGDAVTVAQGEVVNDDLYLAGGSIIIDGTVNGDVFAAGREITINGDINGSVTIGGQFVTINGSVRDSVRLAGMNIVVSGDIGGDAVIFGQMTAIKSGSSIGGDLVVGASSVDINGAVSGRVLGGANNIVITNIVGEDVAVETESLTVASTADIKGNLSYTSKNKAAIQEGARIEGTTTQTLPEIKEPQKTGPAAEIPGKIIGFLMTFITGLVIIFLATRRITDMSEALIKHPWYCLGWGAFLLCVTPLAIIILLITVVGIPIALILTALYAIAIYLSIIPVSLCIGRLIIGRARTENRRGLLLGALAVGLVILILLKLIPIVGIIVGFACALFGLGTIIVAFTKMRTQ